MNDLTITPELIRRFPFAVNPSRITPQDEAWIAAHMHKRVMSERAGIPMKETQQRRNTDTSKALASRYQRTLDKRRVILDIIGMGSYTIAEINAALPKELGGHNHTLGENLRQMKREGYLVNRIERSGIAQIGYWSRTGKEMP